jgi:hypothetical protein
LIHPSTGRGTLLKLDRHVYEASTAKEIMALE